MTHSSYIKMMIIMIAAVLATVAMAEESQWYQLDLGSDRWGALGCALEGKKITLSGHVERANPKVPSKPFLGEFLVVAGGERWVLSYGQSPALDPFVGKPVVAQGHKCQKEGQALIAQHFYMERIRLDTGPSGK